MCFVLLIHHNSTNLLIALFSDSSTRGWSKRKHTFSSRKGNTDKPALRGFRFTLALLFLHFLFAALAKAQWTSLLPQYVAFPFCVSKWALKTADVITTNRTAVCCEWELWCLASTKQEVLCTPVPLVTWGFDKHKYGHCGNPIRKWINQ